MITGNTNTRKRTQELNLPITSLKGIGPKRAELLAAKGITTVLDLIFFTPNRYEDRSRVLPIGKTVEGQAVLVRGKVLSGREERFFRRGKGLFRIIIKDATARLELIWFNYRKVHLDRFTGRGLEVMAYGRIRINRGSRQMIHPDIRAMNVDEVKEMLGFYPIYPQVTGISPQVVRSVVSQTLEKYQDILKDEIPREICRRVGLPELGEAIKCVHFPPEGASIDLFNRHETPYHKRLIFDRFFRVMLNIAFRRRLNKNRPGIVFSIPKDLFFSLGEYFSFTLTGDQVRSIKEILKDLGSGRPMNRLLQGDVGCGKTVVAVVAAYISIVNKWQVALMVPTQILAGQHKQFFSSLPKDMGFRPVLLTGALNRHERLEAYEKIREGEYNLVIGTQSLIQQELSFSRLGLVVIDEQHRFGVRQRALLDRKGIDPHLLVMTATPIPRTLAMTVYADMDISAIKEYPEGHRPVTTFLMDEGRKMEVYNTVRERMSAGQQVLVICPVIEGSEDRDLKNALEMYSGLKKLFTPHFCVGLIHGQLPSHDKEVTMEEFRKGRIDLLVGTTVVEVGIHALGATVIVIEDPERFGLAQIHQLRGRVGRGIERGLCLLMVKKELPEESLSRLKVLAECHDGFEIAQKDLEIRGQGELMGTKQAGSGELEFSEMFREPELLITAKNEAEQILDSDPDLSNPENRILRNIIQAESPGMLDF
jgi:ATP-dependent DNA helicase RecG